MEPFKNLKVAVMEIETTTLTDKETVDSNGLPIQVFETRYIRISDMVKTFATQVDREEFVRALDEHTGINDKYMSVLKGIKELLIMGGIDPHTGNKL